MNQPSRRLVLQVAIGAAWCALGGVFSAAEAGSTKNETRIALDGYDPVAYFTDGRPVKGSEELAFAYDDAAYFFKTTEHRAMFAADPDRYAPQYAGYCTIAVSMGMKADPDPEAWVISDGKLFVFASKKRVPIFAQDPAAIVSKADANWTALRDSP